MTTALGVRDVTLSFGGIDVLDGVSFDVEEQSIVGLIGPNGAGKTSLFNCISGHYRPSGGSISLYGRELIGMRPSDHADAGLARTFQHPVLRLDATILENVLVGGHHRLAGGIVTTLLGLPVVSRSEKELRSDARRLLERLDLLWAADRLARDIPHGFYPRVEICRALLASPKVLLLDEPSAGMPHTEVQDLIGWIREVHDDFGITTVLIGHHMGMINTLAAHVIALEQGRVLAQGTPEEVQHDPRVIEAYLGKGDAA